MSFAALNLAVDMQALSLAPHRFRCWWAWTGGRWRWVGGCEQCGVKWEHFRERQTCLGVLGELMLAGEKIPRRWSANFEERVRIGRRAMKQQPKKRRSHR